MAAAEARALLDQLMGGDRNAPLPKGAALPRSNNRKRGGGALGGPGDSLLLPGKRHKSCYDKDICPLFCAWGVDVYDLFVNTKSDIGPNPYTADEAARQEFLSLPQHERDRLGFEHMLFVKLSELVQQCDRTVQRNQEKLQKELQRQFQKRGGHDYVQDVDEGAVEQLCRNQILLEERTEQLLEAVQRLEGPEIRGKEMELKQQLEQQQQQQQQKQQESSNAEGESNGDGPPKVKEEPSDEIKKEMDTEENHASQVQIKQEPDSQDQKSPTDTTTPTNDMNATTTTSSTPDEQQKRQQLSLELGRITLEKQAILCSIARILSQLGPLQESVETQLRNLYHVKSDITTDKTVCEVSGNFMSARDADERIAAHYAGKQYVGWKLVREKFKEMVAKYGKYGPMPPGRGGGGGGGGPPLSMMMPRHNGGGPRGGAGGGPRGGGPGGGPGGYDRRVAGGSMNNNNRYGGGDRGGDFRGGGGGGYSSHRRGGSGRGGRRSPSPPRWERGVGNSGGPDRGYDNRGGGGGYDNRGRRGSDNRGSRGGGGWNRR